MDPILGHTLDNLTPKLDCSQDFNGSSSTNLPNDFPTAIVSKNAMSGTNPIAILNTCRKVQWQKIWE